MEGRGQWRVVGSGGSWAVEGRGRTTPPALKIANYLTIRVLTYAVNTVCRPPACFVEARFRFNQASGLPLASRYLGLRPAFCVFGNHGSASFFCLFAVQR